MSADLLRRAAATLREGCATLPATMTGEWYKRADLSVMADDGTPHGMLVVDAYNPVDDGDVLDHIARIASPPVVLALADLLEDYATAVDNWPTPGDTPDIAASAVALARAVLRESES